MDLTGKLKSPEFAGCSLPLTIVVDGVKKNIGLAYVGVDGFVNASIDLFRNPQAEKIREIINTRTDMQFSVKINPEVRLERRRTSTEEDMNRVTEVRRPPTIYQNKAREAVESFAQLACEDQAMTLVFDYVVEHLDPSDAKHDTFALDEVYVVSFSYILENWKALISTSLPDGMYYEVTFDKAKDVAYLDPYKRFDHREIPIPSREKNADG